jgi:hypothetical protein
MNERSESSARDTRNINRVESRHSDTAYYIEDCRILDPVGDQRGHKASQECRLRNQKLANQLAF